MLRTTIKNKATLEGTGLHKGKPSRVTFLPAAAPTGLRFLTPGAAPVPARLALVTGTARGTNIAAAGKTLYTVEHLLSAAAGLGVDDLDIEISGEEPPAMDGSALPFARALAAAGIETKPGQLRSTARLAAPFEFSSGAARYRAVPARGPAGAGNSPVPGNLPQRGGSGANLRL